MKIRFSLSSRAVTIVAVFVDIGIVVLADVLSFSLRYGIDVGEANFAAYRKIAFFIVLLRIVCFYVFGLYEKPKYKTNLDNLTNIIKAMTVSSLIIVVVAFYSRAFAYPRTVILLSWGLTSALIMAWRMATRYIINWLYGGEYFASNLLIIGADQQALRLCLHLTRKTSIRNRLIGYITTNNAPPAVQQDKILGSIEDIPDIIKKYSLDEIVISSNLPRETVARIFSYTSGSSIIIRTVPGLYEAVIGKLAATPTDRVPLVELTTMRYGQGWYRGVKRVIDFTFSLAAIIIVTPLLILPLAIIIKCTSRGRVFHKQERAGLHGRPFTMLKLRTMQSDSEDASGPVWATLNDTRVTKIGRFLRKTRLDELPQFFNVLKGDMSLVGPRPERPHFVCTLVDKIPFYTERLEVKPGLTGWAQVNYRYASCLETNAEKIIYDLYYVENLCLSLDLWILCKTIAVVCTGKGV
jgi:exopolysaccharide biosynthesis polyprenyl glycosylphosphotransferase